MAQRLLEARSFLHREEERSPRDPTDGALLIQSELQMFGAAKISAETVTGPLGESFSATRNRREAPLPVWAPSGFPAGMTRQEIDSYPKRPRTVSEIPTFLTANVRRWSEIVQQGPPVAIDTPENALKTFGIDDALAKKAERRASTTAFHDALRNASRRIIAGERFQLGTGCRSEIQNALDLLQALTVRHIGQETHVDLSRFDDGRSLIDRTEIILYHSVFTVVLDQEGNPLPLETWLQFPILVPEAGSVMKRVLPLPGVYISLVTQGDLQFRIGGGPIKKMLSGGVGGFYEKQVTEKSPHEFQRIIQEHLIHSPGSYVAAISVKSAFERPDLSEALVRERVPKVIAEALPLAVEELLARVKAEFSKGWQELLKSIGEQGLHMLIYSVIRKLIEDYLEKKLGGQILEFPFSTAVAVIEAALNKEEILRVRHALAAMLLAVKGTAPDDMTIAAKVLSKIMAEEFHDRLVAELIKLAAQNGIKLVKNVVSPAKPGRRSKAAQPPTQPVPPAEPAKTPKPAKAAAPPPPDTPSKRDVLTEPMTRREIAELERLHAAQKAGGRPTSVDKAITDKATTDKATAGKETGEAGTPKVVKLPPGPPPVGGPTAIPKEGPKLPSEWSDIQDEPGFHEVRTPGGRQPKEGTVAGSVTHKFYEEFPDMLKRRAEEFLPEGALRKGLEREHPIPHPDWPKGSEPRVDRIDWETGEVIEIGPDSQRRQKFIEAQQYAEWMNRYERRQDGKKWWPSVRTYDRAVVREFLGRIGYFKR